MLEQQIDGGKLSKTIQVKGMSGLSIPYIQRFFGHVGTVEEVKKIQDLVLVRFKHHPSLAKALRFNGRVLDKQPIKIRTLSTSIILTQIQSHPKNNITYRSSSRVSNYSQLDQLLQTQTLCLPLIWQNILQIITKLQDDKISWLLHEIFYIKLSQVIHLHMFNTNPSSTFEEVILKGALVGEPTVSREGRDSREGKGMRVVGGTGRKGREVKVVKGEGKVQKLEFMCIAPHQLQDEANFQCFLANVETKLKLKFYEILKQQQASRLYQLYSLLNTHSLHIPQQTKIFPQCPPPPSCPSCPPPFSFSPPPSYPSCPSCPSCPAPSLHISHSLPCGSHIRITVSQHPSPHLQRQSPQRSQYRAITKSHPTKQIQILSDSCLSENSFEQTTYDMFQQNFDGTMPNNCVADLFYSLRMYWVPNLLVLRVRDWGRIAYIRMGFGVRMIGVHGMGLGVPEIGVVKVGALVGDGVVDVADVRMLKHTVVFSELEQPEKIIYMLENYIRFYIPESLTPISTDQPEPTPQLCVIFFQSNPQKYQTNCKALQKISSQLSGPHMAHPPQLYLLQLTNPQEFEKQKCQNFIQEYMENNPTTYNYEIARMHARKLIEENGDKFLHLEHPEDFVTQTIWKLDQGRGKKEAQVRIGMHMRELRGD